MEIYFLFMNYLQLFYLYLLKEFLNCDLLKIFEARFFESSLEK